MQFQMIDDRSSGSDHGLVLFGVQLCQFFGKNLPYMPADQFLLVPATATFDQGLVYRDVTPAGVLHEESGFRQMIEKLLDNRQLSGDDRGSFRQSAGQAQKLRIHGS